MVSFVYKCTLSLCLGILLLLFALYMSARMGIYQETVYAQFGKHPSEALFYNVRDYASSSSWARVSLSVLLVELD